MDKTYYSLNTELYEMVQLCRPLDYLMHLDPGHVIQNTIGCVSGGTDCNHVVEASCTDPEP